jgi:hypothetical protein
MSQEQLNGAQVSAILKQVRRETVAQGVGMDPILQTGALGGLLAGIPHGLWSNGTRSGVAGAARE